MREVIFASLVAASLPAVAQQRAGWFRDERAGVSFRYPSGWTLAKQQPFQFPLLASEPGTMPRALVFTRTIEGIAPWPVTELGGVAFGYDLRRAASAEECRELALPKPKRAAGHGKVTLRGVGYWHSTAGDGGMSQYLAEDLYTTYRDASNSCLLFDFGTFTITAAGAVPPRALNAGERAILHRTEMNLLASIRAGTPVSVK